MGDTDAPCGLLLCVGDIGSKALAESGPGRGDGGHSSGGGGHLKTGSGDFWQRGPLLACGCAEGGRLGLARV